ncbi:hypothetical protein THRCLA_22633 [Thraustotheca clavata]|uniref:tRNA methyltransferase 112 homolog n=1 Tax=Thraustotheca clavata TaxID=74557 RepID=A0A1V9YVH3_9STRA|nr:hypothetical protein THRCLA_22633 [Thraustotheca clavata]
MLYSNKKGVVNGFPLGLKAEETEVVVSEFNADFVRKMLTKIDYSAFHGAAVALGIGAELPATLTEADKSNEDLLKKIHHALLDVHVKKGVLICPESGREYPIVDGIPNMLLREDEV